MINDMRQVNFEYIEVHNDLIDFFFDSTSGG